MTTTPADPSVNPACSGYLVPADIVRAWQRNQKLLEIDRSADKHVGDKLIELDHAVKHKDNVAPSDKQRIVGRKLGDFLLVKKMRGIDNASVSLPSSAGQANATQTVEERTLANIPITYKQRARKIMQSWADKGMSWDEDGNVYLNGSPVSGANLDSLLQHAATRRPRATPPAGYDPVFQHMESEKLPRSTYVNPVWRQKVGDSGGDPFAAAARYTDDESNDYDTRAQQRPLPAPLGFTKYDSAHFPSPTLPSAPPPPSRRPPPPAPFRPSSEWENISGDEEDDDVDDDTIGVGVRPKKRKKSMPR